MRRINLTGLALALLLALSMAAIRAQQAATAANRATPAHSSAARDAAKRITAEGMKKDLYFVASDEMAGRNTPSPGLDATAKFIADRLSAAKLKPAGDDGTYFQKIELRSTSVDADKTRATVSGSEFKYGEGLLPGSFTSGEASGSVVYVGHGWVVKSKNIDAYKGLDVKGKIVVVAGNGTATPPGVTAEYVTGQPTGDWESPVSYAEKHGARGLILIPRNHERVWRFAMRATGRASYQPVRLSDDAEAQADSPNRLPAIVPSRQLLDAIFNGERLGGADVMKAASSNEPGQGFDLAPDKRVSFTVSINASKATTQNVVGVLEGSDPVLKNEYVAVGAHYDHVGTGRPDKDGDAIYNGADDDGSGTVSVLSMAEAFARGTRPKRSILFIWHAGEEKGLWGSEYFTKFPTVPLDRVVAQLNIDMIGRSKKPGDTNVRNRMLTGPDEIYVIGSKMMSTELGALTEAVNASYLNLKYNYHYDEPNDPERLFYRSDHYNYALSGIPIAFFFDGVHEDYHQPSDTPDKIDYQKMEKVARTVFVLASELANAPRRPAVDKKLASGRR